MISMNALIKSTLREIKNSLGRYLAILVITALGVGFFAGLRACRPALIYTAGQYFENQKFYDYRLMSSIGFSKESISVVSDSKAVSAAEGALFKDVFLQSGENSHILRVHSITDTVNTLQLVSGRMPEADNECVADAGYFGNDILGKTLSLSENTSEKGQNTLHHSSFTVVGTAATPLYISKDRGTANFGSGKIAGFVFVKESAFAYDFYKEIYVTLSSRADSYSDDYRKLIESTKEDMMQLAKSAAALSYEKITSDLQKESETINEPSVYVLTRNENAGYAAFEQDSIIIENISAVFPVFFFLVAALVCITTMTRMVDEQRTQIGVWKAMGYSKLKISCKYIFYAGSAGLAGSILGFGAGTALIPMNFWAAYKTSYNFTDKLTLTFNPAMYTFSLLISTLCTAGITFLCCRNALKEVPAAVLRPKPPKKGKRILMERFRAWRNVGFLHKVSLRNVILYKQRFFLMVLGISGCTALLLTGFGIRDSIQNVANYQYGEIVLYDAKITFAEGISKSQMQSFSDQKIIESAAFLSEHSADINAGNSTQSIQLTAVLNSDLQGFINLRSSSKSLLYPQDGEILLCRSLADRLQVNTGEIVTLTEYSSRQITVTVSGVFDNYIGKYAFISENTMTRLRGEAPANAAYVCFPKSTGGIDPVSKLFEDGNVSHISLIEDTKETIETSFSSLNLVVLLIITCAGVLAFIVLFNLININIEERIREIATIKVLGFFNSESAVYVFREVNMLTAAGTLIGLLLGKFLHTFVMAQIRPDEIYFDSRISWSSYLFSIAATIAFASLVKLVMRQKLKKISMAESLKLTE